MSESIYKGNFYGLDSNYKVPYSTFTGYTPAFSTISMATDARTANQLNELSQALNTGVKNIEVGVVQPNVFEAIPKGHFEEMRRAAKLAGSELTFHAPMVDPTGISDRGWDKMAQQQAEKQLWNAMESAHELNKKGTVVTFHATSTGLPGAEIKMKDENGKEKTTSMILVGPGGSLKLINDKETYFPTEKGQKLGEKIPFNPMSQIKKENQEIWNSQMNNLSFTIHRAGDVPLTPKEINQTLDRKEEFHKREIKKEAGRDLNEEEKQILKEQREQQQKQLEAQAVFGRAQLEDSYRMMKGMYDLAAQTGNQEIKKRLGNFSNKLQNNIGFYEDIKNHPDKVGEYRDVITEGLEVLEKLPTPELFKPVKEFAVEKAAETTANLAWKGYNTYKNEAPIIALENHPANQALLTTGEDLKQVVEKSHELFIQKAKAAGMSESEAKKQAQKLIGVTWDVGHINMLRKYGYDEKDLLKQTEAVGKFVKKVHLADNFGFEHTELPMGMGNVPLKEMMKRIGTEGYDVKKVIEAGDWWQHFSNQSKAGGPLMSTLGALGSPLYGGSYEGANPGWNQMYGLQGGGSYFTGYGTMLPDMNFQTYGAGFSSLPMELGGQMAGKDSRFSGTPMA